MIGVVRSLSSRFGPLRYVCMFVRLCLFVRLWCVFGSYKMWV